MVTLPLYRARLHPDDRPARAVESRGRAPRSRSPTPFTVGVTDCSGGRSALETEIIARMRPKCGRIVLAFGRRVTLGEGCHRLAAPLARPERLAAGAARSAAGPWREIGGRSRSERLPRTKSKREPWDVWAAPVVTGARGPITNVASTKAAAR